MVKRDFEELRRNFRRTISVFKQLSINFQTIYIRKEKKKQNTGLHNKGKCMPTPEGTKLMLELHVLGTKTILSPMIHVAVFEIKEQHSLYIVGQRYSHCLLL